MRPCYSCNRNYLSKGKIVSISDFDLEEDGQGVPREEGEDKKLEEMWSRKVRRRSSQLKRLVGDYLDLKEHPKITLLLAKNGWIRTMIAK